MMMPMLAGGEPALVLMGIGTLVPTMERCSRRPAAARRLGALALAAAAGAAPPWREPRPAPTGSPTDGPSTVPGDGRDRGTVGPGSVGAFFAAHLAATGRGHRGLRPPTVRRVRHRVTGRRSLVAPAALG